MMMMRNSLLSLCGALLASMQLACGAQADLAPRAKQLAFVKTAQSAQAARDLVEKGRPADAANDPAFLAAVSWVGRAGVFAGDWELAETYGREAFEGASVLLVGSPDRRMLDLNALTDAGVEVVGRLAGMRDGRAMFSGALANHCALSDLKMNRLLDSIDTWAAGKRVDETLQAPRRFDPTRVNSAPRLDLNLADGAISSVLWATGYRPDYSWLHLPVLDRKGKLRHDGGIVDAPGLYAMGLPFMRRRKSTLIDGAGDDARDLIDHMMAHLDRKAA